MAISSHTLVHFTSGTLSRLVALDEGDGLVNFNTAFRPSYVTTGNTNGPLIIALVLFSGVLQFLVRHIVVRVIGTCLVVAIYKEHGRCSGIAGRSGTGGLTAGSTDCIASAKRLGFAQSRTRRSLSYAFVYSLASACCLSLGYSISASYTWLICAELATPVLLECIHLRWTLSILKCTPTSFFAIASRRLWIPALAYTIAHKLVTHRPASLGLIAGIEAGTSLDAVAARDVATLALSLALRFGFLYPTWACLIGYESDEPPLAQIGGRGPRDIHESVPYMRMLYMLYQKLLLRLAMLHLQAAGTMVLVEALAYMVAIALLS